VSGLGEIVEEARSDIVDAAHNCPATMPIPRRSPA
jgi:hypothetical protein